MTALVTGASGGLGSAIVTALVDQGATVAVSGSNAAKLKAFAAGFGGKAIPLVCDLSDPAAVDALVPQAVDALGGKLDILANNAGVTRDNLLMRMKDEDWATVLDVDLGVPFRLARAALRGMVRRRAGRIIGIGSIVGTTGNPGQANYAAAKAGLTGMSKALAAEVASRGVTVNCVAPGFITTAMTDKLSDEQRAGLLGHVPLGRMGAPEEVAAAVLYLASPEAAYVTGATLHVNGGMAML